jgi:hypothetical protein
VRQIVYTFEARIARQWRDKRVFLAGDAAHTMPPFQGQGMCSGMRDAMNLAWKIDHVMRGWSSDALLDTYQQERYAHVYDWTIISIESGKIPCTLDPVEAEARDARFRGGWRPPMPDFPRLKDGVLARDAEYAAVPLAGQLGLQARVKKDGRSALFDDLFPGHGYVVLSTAADPRGSLSESQLAWLDSLGTRFVYVGPEGDPHVDAIDIDGEYARYFAAHGVEVMIVRPDFYVFGAGTLESLPALVESLRQGLFTADAGNVAALAHVAPSPRHGAPGASGAA